MPSDYLQWLQEACADVGLLGLRVQHGQSVTLNSVYVPLTTQATHEEARGPRTEMAGEGRGVEPLLHLLDKDSLYVAGPPGSGKSTFCSWVAWLACEGEIPDAQLQPPDEYRERIPSSFQGRLPLLLRLRDFWTHLKLVPGCREMSAAELKAALAAWVDAKQPGGLTWSVVQPHLDGGSLLLILDGLDEVPLTHGDPKSICQPRAMLLSGLTAALKKWTGEGTRVLLTSRPYGLSQRGAGKLPLRSVRLGDLDEPMRELLVRRWFHCLVDRAETAEATAAQMLGHLGEREDIQELAANPMLLTAICIIYQQGQRLPEGRSELYDRVVDNVLFNRFPEDRTVIDPVRNRLAVVAYGMHTGEGLGEERTTPQAEATHAEIDRLIQAYQDQTPHAEPGYTSAVEVREQLLSRTGLLLPQGENRAGFYHLTFQDFFAAQRLLDVRETELFDVFRERGGAPEWHSTLSFAFGSQLAQHSSPQRSTVLMSELVESLTDDDVGLAVVVGECLQILLKQGVRLKSELEERLRQYCLAAIEREAPVRERHELGLALGHLGDPRVTMDLREREAYVEIRSGRYRVGDDALRRSLEKQYGAGPWTLTEAEFELDQPLLLSRFPVTNGQYAIFIDEGGYDQRQWWSDAGWDWREQNNIAKPRYWLDAKWNAPNKPVVGVSYWEAEAFASWAGGRLPSDREWEAAARGLNGHAYPWGDEWQDGICNSSQANLGETTAVGMFPRSRSTDSELDDMAGNVWEWCADKWGPDTGQLRVMRGGSWGPDAQHCRSAFRDGDDPECQAERAVVHRCPSGNEHVNRYIAMAFGICNVPLWGVEKSVLTRPNRSQNSS